MKPFLFCIAIFSGIFLIACKKDINTSNISSTGSGADALGIPNAPLLFASGNKTIHILNANTGNIAYEDDLRERPGINISGAPAFINDSIAIIPSSNKMFCVNYTNKKVIWEARFDTVGQPGHNFKPSEICINSSNVFMAYADYQAPWGTTRHASKFFAVDIATGNISWAIDLLQLGFDYDIFSSPFCTEETVYLPVRNKLFAFDTKTGAMKWEFATDTYANLFNPAYANEKIFVASFASGYINDSVFALDMHSGSKIWGKEVLEGLSNNPAPVVYNNRLFINVNNNRFPLAGGVLCINASDGSDVWQYTRPAKFDDTAGGMCPVFIDNDMLFASELGHTTVYRLNIETGEEIWRSYAAVLSVYSTNQDEGPLASGGMVYFKTTSADMYALNAADGSVVWTTTIDAGQTRNINTGPVLRDASGKFIYSSESGMRQ